MAGLTLFPIAASRAAAIGRIKKRRCAMHNGAIFLAVPGTAIVLTSLYIYALIIFAQLILKYTCNLSYMCKKIFDRSKYLLKIAKTTCYRYDKGILNEKQTCIQYLIGFRCSLSESGFLNRVFHSLARVPDFNPYPPKGHSCPVVGGGICYSDYLDPRCSSIISTRFSDPISPK